MEPDVYAIRPIARIHTDFPEKFGIPRQSGLVAALEAEIVFEPDFRAEEAVRGLEDFSHVWLIWGFSEARRTKFSPTVRPPRLGGNTRMGVFATRSPFRPNGLALSCVKLAGVDLGDKRGPVLRVLGADLMDGTPIYDIKPYLPHADCQPDAVGGFSGAFVEYALKVNFPEHLLQRVPEQKREALLGVLAQDPRPAYQQNPTREYGLSFGGLSVRFTVDEQILTVISVDKQDEKV